MDVRIHKRGREERALRVKLGGSGGKPAAFNNGADAAVLDADVDRLGMRPAGRVQACVANDKIHCHPLSGGRANGATRRCMMAPNFDRRSAFLHRSVGSIDGAATHRAVATALAPAALPLSNRGQSAASLD